MEIVLVLAYCLLREVFFIYSQQKLVNKLMSRSYHEYESANRLGQKVKAQRTVSEEPMENLVDLNQMLS